MKQRTKQGLTVLLTLLLLVSAWQTNIFTAQAFSVRRTKPSAKDSHYYSGANPFYAGGYLNECTWYVWGRAYEALGAKPNLPTVAAHRWYQDNKNRKACSYGAKPKVGAVMITVKDGSHGHVAFVEELYSNGTMLISEYNYGVRNGFSTQVIKQLPAGATRGRKHKVLGYIYVTAAKPVDKVAPTISELKVTKMTSLGFELSAKATDKVGVTSVKFQVRTADQDWQDAVSFNAALSSADGCWKSRIPFADFDESCVQYVVRCCVADAAGNKASDELTVSVPQKDQNAAPADSEPSAKNPFGIGSSSLPGSGLDLFRSSGSGFDRSFETFTSFWSLTDASADQPSGGTEPSLAADPFTVAFVPTDSFDFAQICAESLRGWAAAASDGEAERL